MESTEVTAIPSVEKAEKPGNQSVLEITEIARKKEAYADLQFHHPKTLEVGFILTLILLIGGFQLSRGVTLESESIEQVEVKINVADVPQTEQIHRPPPPPRPSIAVPTDDENIPEDLTIETTDLDLSDIPPPPPPPDDDDEHFFVAYDEPPQIIGGLAALSKLLDYPSVARKSGVEGRVIAKVLVSTSGRTDKVEILKSSAPGMGFEDSAIKALKKVKWKPATQRDRSVKTWITVPVIFRLTNSPDLRDWI